MIGTTAIWTQPLALTSVAICIRLLRGGRIVASGHRIDRTCRLVGLGTAGRTFVLAVITDCSVAAAGLAYRITAANTTFAIIAIDTIYIAISITQTTIGTITAASITFSITITGKALSFRGAFATGTFYLSCAGTELTITVAVT